MPLKNDWANGDTVNASNLNDIATAVNGFSSGAASWADLSGKPAVIAAGTTQATARAAIGAVDAAAVTAAVNAVLDGAPGALDTLNELAAAINDDASFAATVTSALSGKQPSDATLTALAGVTTAANKLIYATGADAFTTTDLTAAGRAILDDADAAAQRATLGVPAATDLAGESDYVVSVSAGTYTATPRLGSGHTRYSGTDFTAVLQSVIDDLTTGAPDAGTFSSGGGKIHIAAGQYTMSNAVTITGWEGIAGTEGSPQSALTIEGEGRGTRIYQNTSGQNAFVVKNCAAVNFVDMWGFVDTAAASFILGDNTGVDSEMSFWGGTIRIKITSNSTTAAPIHIKNFFDIDVPAVDAFSTNYHAIVLENNSTTTNFGNSHFGQIRATGSTTTPYAGLVLKSANTSKRLNLLTFEHYECNGSYYGIYTKGALWCSFSFVDLESNQTCLYFDGDTLGQYQSRYFTVSSGYMFPRASGTGIRNQINSGGHKIRAFIETGAGSVVPINDTMEFLPYNSYDITVPAEADIAAIAITATGKQRLIAEPLSGARTERHPADITVASSPSNGDNTTKLATTAFVAAAIPYNTHAASSKTTPVDADELALVDSAASNGLKKLTWANLKAAMPPNVASTFVDAYVIGSPAQTATQNVWTKITLSTENVDTGNNFDNSSTYLYTIPATGLYQFNALVRLSDSASLDTNVAIIVDTSGFDGAPTQWYAVKTTANGNRTGLRYVRTASFTAAQTVGLFVYSPDAAVSVKSAQLTAMRVA